MGQKLGIVPEWLRRWAQFQRRNVPIVKDAILDMEVSMALLDTLDKTGVLNLE